MTAVARVLVEQFLTDRRRTEDEWDFSKVTAVWSAHNDVQRLAFLLLEEALNNPPIDHTGSCPSLTELFRAERSLLLMQAWYQLSVWLQVHSTFEVLDQQLVEYQLATAFLDMETDQHFMHVIARAFQEYLSDLQMDQIRNCGVMLSRHLAYGKWLVQLRPL